MGLLSFIFKGKKDLQVKRSTKWLDIFNPYFSGDDSQEMSSTYMSICDAHARHLSKIEAKAYLKDKPAESKKYITTLLTLRPNPLMNAPVFWETVARNYYLTNNAFIFLEWDYQSYKEPLKALWILDPDLNSMQIRTSENGKVFISFRLDGKEMITAMENIAIISRNVEPSKFFGSKNKAIRQVLKVLKTNYEGIEQAVKISSFIRFIATSVNLLNDEVKKEKAKYFAETYLGKDSSGVVYIDQATDVKQVTTNPKYADAEQLAIFKKDVYEYLGANDKITTASYNEDDWQAYYESSLEPFIIKVMAELTYKIYVPEEIAKGNKIYVNADMLQSASLKTKIRAAETYLKLPVIIPNVVNKILGFPESEHGNEDYSNLNFVKSKDQTKYQTGKEDNEDKKKEDDEDATDESTGK